MSYLQIHLVKRIWVVMMVPSVWGKSSWGTRQLNGMLIIRSTGNWQLLFCQQLLNNRIQPHYLIIFALYQLLIQFLLASGNSFNVAK